MAKKWFNKKVLFGATPLTIALGLGGLYYLKNMHSVWHTKEDSKVLFPLDNIKGLGMTTSTSTSTSSSHVPDMMRRQNEDNWNYSHVSSGMFGVNPVNVVSDDGQVGPNLDAVPPSIGNRVRHRGNSGDLGYTPQIDPSFSVDHKTMSSIDAADHADLLTMSGLSAGSNGSWFL